MLKAIVIVIFSFFALRDILFRIFFIFPVTKLNGRYAFRIEDTDLLRWVSPMISHKVPEIGFVGNSHIMDAIDPEIVSSSVNKSAYNLALYYLPTANMVEILNENKCYPAYCFIDFSTRYSMYNESYSYLAQSLNKIPDGLFRRYELLDIISTLAPSFFVPAKYNFFLKRTIKKMQEYKKKKYFL